MPLAPPVEQDRRLRVGDSHAVDVRTRHRAAEHLPRATAALDPGPTLAKNGPVMKASSSLQPSLFPTQGMPVPGEALGRLFDDLNHRHFDDKLPRCKIRWNPRLRTTAGRVDLRARVIELSPAYHRRFGAREMHDTLLHEMLHVAQHVRGSKIGHTAEMKRIARRLGIDRLHAKETPDRRPLRYRYRCPSCRRTVWRRIRIGRNRSACAPCCNHWNAGRWHPRYVLVLDAERPPHR